MNDEINTEVETDVDNDTEEIVLDEDRMTRIPPIPMSKKRMRKPTTSRMKPTKDPPRKRPTIPIRRK